MTIYENVWLCMTMTMYGLHNYFSKIRSPKKSNAKEKWFWKLVGIKLFLSWMVPKIYLSNFVRIWVVLVLLVFLLVSGGKQSQVIVFKLRLEFDSYTKTSGGWGSARLSSSKVKSWVTIAFDKLKSKLKLSFSWILIIGEKVNKISENCCLGTVKTWRGKLYL